MGGDRHLAFDLGSSFLKLFGSCTLVTSAYLCAKPTFFLRKYGMDLGVKPIALSS